MKLKNNNLDGQKHTSNNEIVCSQKTMSHPTLKITTLLKWLPKIFSESFKMTITTVAIQELSCCQVKCCSEQYYLDPASVCSHFCMSHPHFQHHWKQLSPNIGPISIINIHWRHQVFQSFILTDSYSYYFQFVINFS